MIFEPDVILPTQLQGHLLSRMTPEQTLCAAVLEDAIRCYRKHAPLAFRTKLEQRLYLETFEWFADTAADWPFSFLRICEVLYLDPGYVRRGLLPSTRPASMEGAAITPSSAR